jgi:D-alanine-D-alanine ligase
MKTNTLNIVILYSDSEFTPWKENINMQTIISLAQALSLQHKVTVAHFTGMEDSFASFLQKFDLVYNVCYGFHEYSQTDITAWLEENGIPHTASPYKAQCIAQDKGLLPLLCTEIGLQTPPLLQISEIFSYEGTMILKPRYGSLHRGIQLFTEKNIPVADVLNEANIVQPYINGREFTVAVVPTADGTSSICLPPIEVIPFEQQELFIAGNASGRTYINYEPDIDDKLKEKIMNHVLRIHRRMGLQGMSRTDVRIKNNQVFILDVNAMPNIEPQQSFLPNIAYYNGITYAELINRMVNCFAYHYAIEETWKETAA